MKVLSVDGLSKLISLMKEDFVESSSLSTVATSGDYDDLTNKPTIPEGLPSQSGQSGKYLTTNGSTASWGSITALQNTATGTNSLTIGGTAATLTQSINIGASSSASGTGGVSIGYNASTSSSVAIGSDSSANYPDSIAIGKNAVVNAAGGIQIGQGTTSDESLYVALGYITHTNYKLLGSNGKIPDDRLNTTIARTSQIPTIATTSTTGLVKPDGTSITVDANGVISSAAGVEIDEETITKNGSNELQVVAVKNKRDDSTLPIWHGTEYQWNHGVPTTWYYWETSSTAMWVSGGSLSSSDEWRDVEFGNNRFVVISSVKSFYSTDSGETWHAGGSGFSNMSDIIYGDNRFVLLGNLGSSSKYSTDGGETWQAGGNLPSSGMWRGCYGNGRFVAVLDSSADTAYSTDGGETWHTGGSLPSSGRWRSVAFGNNRFVALKYSSTDTAYSTDGGETWHTGGSLPSSISCEIIVFGNGIFGVCNSSRFFYSIDGGETWNAGGSGFGSNPYKIKYGDNKFYIFNRFSADFAYSTDNGTTWIKSNLPNSGIWDGCYGNEKVVSVKVNSTDTAIFSVTYDKCYTDTANPTTTSTVYSEPAVTSSYTISSVTSGAITLSNNNTYYYTQGGNAFTYRTIGDAHPEYLCFIDGVGVKMDNTLIASATPITTSITSTSTDAEAPSAKAVYDEVGEVESALNTINSGS